ncbi:response regulator [Arenibaculum pallidiluteum]|uniref:response regulator n=1 Tax=Arenibaculum pallidiluteum TaxID=2812559 RepID=UPI001A976DFA|nr:response regulator [Arenibaculum pallidiluteum]
MTRRHLLTIRACLLLLALVCAGPPLLLAAVLIAHVHREQFADTSAQTLETVRALRLAVDRELEGRLRALEVLATAGVLRSGGIDDIGDFADQAREMAALQPPGSNVILADRTGRELVNTLVPDGQPLPHRNGMQALERVFATGRPLISNLITGAVSGLPSIAISVPVTQGGRVTYDLTLGMPAAVFVELLARQRVPEGWTVAVIDGAGTIIARNRASERYVGQPVTPSLRELMATGLEGTGTTWNQEGSPVITAFSRSEISDWSLVIGVPSGTLPATLRSFLIYVLGGALVLMASAGFVAWQLAERIAGPVRAIAGSAEAIAGGGCFTPEPTGLAELDSVTRTLAAAVDARAESDARLRLAIASGHLSLWELDLATGAVARSPEYDRIFGYDQPLETWTHERFLSHVLPEDLERVEAAVRAAVELHAELHLECRIRRADGTVRWIECRGSIDRRAGSAVQRMVGVLADVTERKAAECELQQLNATLEQRVLAAVAEREQAEAALRQAQKMEAVGQLTGGVAHDFNNLLQVISGNLQLLAQDIAGNERAEARVRNALAGVARGSKLASSLLAFARKQPLQPRAVDLGRLVRSLDDMLRRAVGEGVEIEIVSAAGLWNTLVDPTQVENALLNLAINARDAMEGRGRLSIETGNTSLDERYATRHRDVVPGQYVMLAVSDTGSGMAPEVMERAFEPFFSTKPEGQGTGLGLSMVYGFVKQSGGHINIYSEAGQGTTIRLYLPRTHEAEDLAAAMEAGPVEGGTESILVVEDDDDVRATVVAMLADLGYRVHTARDALGALAILESDVPVDLLFTDVVMPGPLRGPELASRARERQPGIAVLFTSGFTDNAIVHDGRLDAGVELLSKPYTQEALARKLRQVLRDRGKHGTGAGAPTPDARQEEAGQEETGLSILLVEDDALIRLSTSAMLVELGHAVRWAADGAEALSILEEKPFDLLLTDMALPGISGVDLARQAVARFPWMRVVIATGHDIHQAEMPNGARLLRKPYDVAALRRVMRTATRQKAGR